MRRALKNTFQQHLLPEAISKHRHACTLKGHHNEALPRGQKLLTKRTAVRAASTLTNVMSAHPRNPLPKANTTLGELHQIHGYVEATNTRILYLEELLEPSVEDHVVEIKKGLKNAHGRLERLQDRDPMVAVIAREVWQTYRRLRELEERLRGVGKRDDGEGWANAETRIVRAQPEVQTASVDGVEDCDETEEHDEEEEEEEGGIDVREADGYERQREKFHMSGGLVPPSRDRLTLDSSTENEVWYDALPSPGARPMETQTGVTRVASRYYVPNGVEERVSVKFDPKVWRRKTVHFAEDLIRTPSKVMVSIAEEESKESAALHDPDRQREGSAHAWRICLAIMSCRADGRLFVPHLRCIKIHEIRGMKLWLAGHNYVRRTGSISKIEKILYLITLLTYGCRFEAVAVFFSRSPRQVLDACKQVFEGLLEMHSETMLPRRDLLHNYLYGHLWHIVGNYTVRFDESTRTNHYPWPSEDVCKVVLTINIFIGRFRGQGGLALDGPILNWGRQLGPIDVEGWVLNFDNAAAKRGANSG